MLRTRSKRTSIGFDGIPQLAETEADVRTRSDLHWMGAFVDGRLVGLIAWEGNGDEIEIDRLAVDPTFGRHGLGRRLVRSVPPCRRTLVSTGGGNRPAVDLYLSESFERTGSTEIAPNVVVAHFHRDI